MTVEEIKRMWDKDVSPFDLYFVIHLVTIFFFVDFYCSSWKHRWPFGLSFGL